MAYTLSQLVTDIQNRLDDTGFSSTILKQFINDAQNEYTNGRFFRFMEATQSYTLTVGVADITNGAGLPTTFQMPTMLRITTANYEKVLPFMDYTEFRKTYPSAPNDANGTPKLWYEYGGTISVYPKPDTALAVSLDYIKKPTTLSGDSDVPQIPSEWGELLTLGAYKRALEYNDDFDLAQAVQYKIDELLLDMTRRLSTRMTAPAVMPINRTKTSSVLGG